MGFSKNPGIKKLGLPDMYKNEGFYSIHYNDELEHKKIVKCKFENISDFCERNEIYPDIIKIDVEGSEIDILESMSRKMLFNLKYIIIELNDKPIPPQTSQVDQIVNILLKKDFVPVMPCVLGYKPGTAVDQVWANVQFFARTEPTMLFKIPETQTHPLQHVSAEEYYTVYQEEYFKIMQTYVEE